MNSQECPLTTWKCLQRSMESVVSLFGVMLGQKVLRFADNLSHTLQQKELSAAEGQLAAELTVDTLATHRNEEEFEKFWASIMD